MKLLLEKRRMTIGDFLSMSAQILSFLIGLAFLCVATYLCLGSMPFELAAAFVIVIAIKHFSRKAHRDPSVIKTTLGNRDPRGYSRRMRQEYYSDPYL